MVGKVGHSPVSVLAERAIEFTPKRSNAVVTMAMDGTVWLDRPCDANMRVAIATVTAKSDPDWLADELRFEARARGML